MANSLTLGFKKGKYETEISGTYFGHCLEVTNAIAANFKSSSKHHGSVGCTVNSLYTPTPNACAKL